MRLFTDGVRALALAAACIATAAPARAQTAAQPAAAATNWSREADLVQGWYRDYLGRSVGPELTAWVQLLRGGMSPIDVQATILGSEEQFQRQGRDPATFVRETLEGVTWEAPDSETLRRWNDRLTQLRGDRVALAREILLASSQQTQQPTADTLHDQVTRLETAARLLVDNASFELAGTAQGRQVSLRARALLDAADQLHQQVGVRAVRVDQLATPFNAVVRAYEAVQQALANPPGTAPSSAAVARRIGTTIVEMQAFLQSQATTPRPTTPNYQTYDQQLLLTQVDSVSRAVQSVRQVLAPAANQDYRFGVALRDLDGLSSRVAAFADLTRRGASREQLDYDLQTLRAQADRIRPQLFESEPPLFTRLYWLSVEAGLEQMRDTLKASGGISTPVTTTRPDATLISLADLATTQIDAFLTGVSPLVYGVPDVPRLQRNVRTLRNRVLQFRQMVVEGKSQAELTSVVRQVAADYQTAESEWTQIVAYYRLIDPAQLQPVGATIDRMYQALTAPVQVTTKPATDSFSQAQRLLGAFDQELTAFQTTLAPFQNYPEFSPLKVFINQMAGYSRSIADLEKDPVRNRDQQRRYAAGMQRLIDLFDAYSTRIEDRTKAQTAPEPRQAASDLRQRVRRLGGLVNDLESQLH